MKIIQLNQQRNQRIKNQGDMPYWFVDNLIHQNQNDWKIIKPTPVFELAYPEDVFNSNEKYCVYINVFDDLIFPPGEYAFLKHNRDETDPNKWLNVMTMNPHIWEDSGKGNVLWIVDWSTETYISKDWIDITMLPYALNIKDYQENLIVLTGAELRYKDINQDTRQYCDKAKGKSHVFTCDTLASFLDRIAVAEEIQQTDYLNKKIKSIYQKEDREYYSVCYNRLPRMHRSYIVSHMMHMGYIDKCNYSLGIQAPFIGQYANLPTQLRPELIHYIRHLGLDPNVNDTYIKLRESSKDEQGIEQQINTKHESMDLNFNQADNLNLNQGMHNYLHIVTETMAIDTCASPLYHPTFLTEKSYKPFLMLQPFIAFGSKDNLLSLQYKGFDVFDKWIDVSYDSIVDEGKRLKLFLKELDRLHSLSIEEWKQLSIDMLPSVLHNYYNYFNYDPNDVIVDICSIAMQFEHKVVQ